MNDDDDKKPRYSAYVVFNSLTHIPASSVLGVLKSEQEAKEAVKTLRDTGHENAAYVHVLRYLSDSDLTNDAFRRERLEAWRAIPERTRTLLRIKEPW